MGLRALKDGARHAVRIRWSACVVLLLVFELSGLLTNSPQVWAGELNGDTVREGHDTADDFEATAADVFLRRCLECHAGEDAEGGLDLTSGMGLAAGGDSGPAVVPGDAQASFLLQRVAAGEMPPEKNGASQALPAEEREMLAAWIAAGARWPEGRVLDLYERTTGLRAGRDWWSLQPLAEVTLPAGESVNPIDRFVEHRLAEAGLAAAPEADRRTLLRRLSFDLIGLPPSPDEMAAFLTDDSPDAYERQVDRLLASPHFGERQARRWLDVARFAETNGYERDAEKPGAWRYRDWVVEAFNSDMPFDQFVTLQLAGDEVADRNEASVIATGFLRVGTWDDEPNDDLEYRYERLEDLVHVTSTAFLGLTLKCARCHDHKFDAVLQEDYYRMAAAFWPGPITARDRALMGGPSADELGYDVLGWTDITTSPEPLRLLAKGDPHRPLHPVAAGSFSCVPSSFREFAPPVENATTTGRRRQLADWIASASNPLTPRVIVNRLWQHHFGEGLCSDPDNLGFNGPLPTHPALLDWLARDLMEGGWTLKRLHQLMVTSNAYRRISLHPDPDAVAKADPDNRLLSHARRRRLDAESLRDAMLAVSGELDRRVGGESFRQPISSEALEGLSMKGGAYTPSPAEDCLRRSLYMFSKRGLIVPMMTTFDQCDTTMPTGRRDVSIVPTQALTLLNNQWVGERAGAFAASVMAEDAGRTERIRLAWQRALNRHPLETEVAAATAYLDQAMAERGGGAAGDHDAAAEQAAWASLCLVLFNTNEFVFVD
jgi:hypothetical protein